MAIFDDTPSQSTLEKAAYCALYEIIKEGINNIEDLRTTLKECVTQCATLNLEERKTLEPVYKRAYELSCQHSFSKVKELANEVSYSK